MQHLLFNIPGIRQLFRELLDNRRAVLFKASRRIAGRTQVRLQVRWCGDQRRL